MKKATKSELFAALDSAAWPAILINGTGMIAYGNKTAIGLFGLSVLEDELLSDIWAPGNSLSAEQFLEQSEQSPVPAALLRFRVSGGGMKSLHASISTFKQANVNYTLLQILPGSSVGAASAASAPAKEVASTDTSTLQKADLIQKQKLDCALQLARTVSLDFNNALTSILGHTSLLLSQAPTEHPWRSSLMEVEKSAARAAEIANDLAAFSRQEKVSRTQSDGNLNSILQRSVEIFQNSNQKPTQKIEWALQLGPKLYAAKFDEAKMQQTFVKVLENAVQALDGSGCITIQSRNVELSEGTHDREVRLAPGTYICAEINDTGTGIEPDVLPRIFEPFFTTKKSSGHRGLGLALVYGIVTNHGGGVAVSSQPGSGTSVRIYLPAEKKIVRDSVVRSKDLNGSQTILMVDDEDLLLTMGQTVLSAYGYTVLTANSGAKALDIFTNSDKGIELVITDLVMPTMSGRELMEHIQRIAPGTRILCTSGFVRPQSEDDSTIYLQKPFTSQDLLVKVKQAIART